MSEVEQEIEVEETTQDNEPVEVDIPAEDVPQKASEEEFDPKKRVEFTTPEQQKKFNDVYKQMKMSDARNAFQGQLIEKLYERLEALENNHTQTGKKDAESLLKQRIKTAREMGDEEAEAAALNDLVQFKVDSALQGKQPKGKPVNPIEQMDSDEQYVYGLAIEKDDTGNLKRPWMQETHPRYQEMLDVAKDISEEYGNDPVVVMQKLDELMAPPKKTTPPKGNTRAPDPLRGNLTIPQNKSKIKLSSKEAEIARKLGVSLSDYAKYRI